MTYKKEERAFSLVEILVALIAVSCISAALAPVITKKLRSNRIVYQADEIRVPPGCNKFTAERCHSWDGNLN